MATNLIVVGRRREQVPTEFADVDVRPVVADLRVEAGLNAVTDLCASERISMLVNKAGFSNYMAFGDLPPEKAHELLAVKLVAPTMFTRATVSDMLARGGGPW